MESLKDQAQEIDNPNVPREEGKVFIDLMPKKQVAQSLATFSSPKVVDRALELENTMQQMQPGEFADWDPKLDAGARLGDDQNELRAQKGTYKLQSEGVLMLDARSQMLGILREESKLRISILVFRVWQLII